ncbi:MAG: phytanoyl-CoA dioxygenase family protein [Acidimicrobiales bacterium]|nr:phytanoyl-CoA dioxygenase family protein [Acidimicrobiales bacterium]MCB1040702.1 phytanoyl-CoA dioxygenase family protein [Acidimicrobiales bacterium]
MGHVANLRAAGRRDKVVDDPLLNRCGIQVARTVAARARHAIGRRRPPADADVASWVRSLRREGLVVVEDFLATEAFEAVRSAATAALDDPSLPRDHVAPGDNQLEVVWRSDLDERSRSTLDQLWCEPRLAAIATAAERASIAPGAGRCTLQRLVQRAGSDHEAQLHVDTFYPTHKAWLYLTDVDLADGPLRYVARSHRLDPTVLRAVYRESVGLNGPSRRIADDEVRARGLRERVLTCTANTLVVADTSGYHGRHQGAPGAERVALHLEWRLDPFRRRPMLEEDRSTAIT